MINFREFLSANPFVKITSLFIVGILLNSTELIEIQLTKLILPSLFILLSILFFTNPVNRSGLTMLFSLTFILLIIMFGIVWSNTNNQIASEKVIFKSNIKDQWYTGFVTEPVKEGKKFASVVVSLKSPSSTIPLPSSTKAIVYLPRTKKTEKINYRDVILFKSKLNKIKKNENPYDFNFQKIYHPKGITHQTFVDSAQWMVSPQAKQNSLKNIAYSVRKKYLNVLNTHIKDSVALGIAQSLILGDRGNISKDTKEMFQEVGAMHLLAISGLHLGIIYLILTKCLFFLKRNRTELITKFFLVCLFLWSYALITGFSSSVVRAALMLTIFDLGSCLQKKSTAFNSLFAAAFVLLIINPDNIFQIGFQLSYLAVLGILLGYERIYGLYKGKIWILKKIWQSFALTFSAQILIAPLLLFYFNYLSLTSFITNLIAIPIVTFIVSIGIPSLLFSSFPSICYWLLHLLESLIILMTNILKQIQQLSFLNIEVFDYGPAALVSTFILLTLCYLYYLTKRTNFLHLLLLLLIINTILSIKKDVGRNLSFDIHVYKTPCRFLCEIVYGRENILLSDRKYIPQELTTKLKNYWKARGIEKTFFVTTKMLENGKCFQFPRGSMKKQRINFNSNNILILNNSKATLKPMKKPNADIIICSKESLNQLAKTNTMLKNTQIIFDSSVDSMNKEIPFTKLKKDGNSLFFVRNQGYWTKSFDKTTENIDFIW